VDRRLEVLTTYGFAMAAVQRLEYSLGGVVAITDRVKQPRKRLDDAEKVRDALEVQWARFGHRFGRATAGELRNMLPDDIDSWLVTELEELTPIRNDLAHTYLVRRMLIQAPDADYRSQLGELRELAGRFNRAAEKLDAIAEQKSAGKPEGLSDEQYATLQRLGAEASLGVALDDALVG
jgi:hypothetical protein